MNTTVAIMARVPRWGKVKTRLAATIGPGRTLQLYAATLADIAKTVADFSSAAFLYWDSDGFYRRPAQVFSRSLRQQLIHRQQGPGDLGQKMFGAMSSLLAQGHAKALLVGSDFPALTSQHLGQAARWLDQHPVVFGPASDGGYYLIGMRKVFSFLFNQLPWGRNTVLSESLARCQQAGVAYGLLPVEHDVDTVADLKHLAYDSRLSFRTRRVLTRWGLP